MSGLERKTPLRPRPIRQLRPGDPIPEGEPRRYTSDKRGYVRLRWKMPDGSYLETYEHRLAAGVPDAEVHHRNEDKGDNDLENLEPLTKAEHARRHGDRLRPRGIRPDARKWTEWGGLPNRETYERRQRAVARRAERQVFLAEVARMYRSGMTVQEVADELGKNNSTISRALRASGAAPRREGAAREVGGVAPYVRQLVQARARLHCERCTKNLTWAPGHVHHRQLKGMGGTRLPGAHLPPNLVHLCPGCHSWVHGNVTDAIDGGWIVRSWEDPATTHVILPDGRAVILTPDGRYADTDTPDLPATAPF